MNERDWQIAAVQQQHSVHGKGKHGEEINRVIDYKFGEKVLHFLRQRRLYACDDAGFLPFLRIQHNA